MFNPVPPLYLPDVISYCNESAHLTFRVLSWSVLLDAKPFSLINAKEF
jgi:hypothetical protein